MAQGRHPNLGHSVNECLCILVHEKRLALLAFHQPGLAEREAAVHSSDSSSRSCVARYLCGVQRQDRGSEGSNCTKHFTTPTLGQCQQLLSGTAGGGWMPACLEGDDSKQFIPASQGGVGVLLVMMAVRSGLATTLTLCN